MVGDMVSSCPLHIIGIPILFHSTMSFLCWALQMPVLDTPGFQIRVNEILSNNIRILTPN